MNNQITYDVAIVGAGIAGSMAAHRLIQKNSKLKIILIDIGRPPGKRRRQIEGFMGCLPNGDGRFYYNNFEDILEICDGRKVNSIYQYLIDWLSSIESTKYIKDNLPSSQFQKKMKADGWDFRQNNYFQWSPKYLHEWIHQVSDSIENKENIKYQFDTVIDSIEKENNCFKLNHDKGNIVAHKILIASGRTGWRWIKEVFEDLQMPMEDDWAEFGIRIEIAGQYIKDLKDSSCIISNENKKTTLGPLSWHGTVIPEDHADLVISSFRSNEPRWRSEKLTMSLTKKISFPKQGVEQNERLSKLSFLLLNDRISKEKIKLLFNKSIIISELKEFNWLCESLTDLNQYLPNLITKGYFYIPTIITRPPRVKLDKNLKTPIEGLYLAGESANQFGILSAAITGMVAADGLSNL